MIHASVVAVCVYMGARACVFVQARARVCVRASFGVCVCQGGGCPSCPILMCIYFFCKDSKVMQASPK